MGVQRAETLIGTLGLVLLLGLAVTFLMKVHEHNRRIASLEKLKMFSLASLHAVGHNHQFPPMLGDYKDAQGTGGWGPFFFHLLDHIEYRGYPNTAAGSAQEFSELRHGTYKVMCYLNPADPTVDETGKIDGLGACSYAANFQVFGRSERKGGNLRPIDWERAVPKAAVWEKGTAHTLLFAERYARCGDGGGQWGRVTPDLWQPTFAAWSDEPFQVRPSTEACDPRRASTPFAGLNVAMADGSTRTIAPGIAPAAWWALCDVKRKDEPAAD